MTEIRPTHQTKAALVFVVQCEFREGQIVFNGQINNCRIRHEVEQLD